MSIPAISAIAGAAPTLATGPTPSTTQPAGAGGFATQLTGAIDNLQQLQSTSDSLNVQAATGNLNDIQSATIAAARVETTVQLVSTLRNQAVDSFNDIMKMD